jgi:hypothetical protein
MFSYEVLAIGSGSECSNLLNEILVYADKQSRKFDFESFKLHKARFLNNPKLSEFDLISATKEQLVARIEFESGKYTGKAFDLVGFYQSASKKEIARFEKKLAKFSNKGRLSPLEARLMARQLYKVTHHRSGLLQHIWKNGIVGGIASRIDQAIDERVQTAFLELGIVEALENLGLIKNNSLKNHFANILLRDGNNRFNIGLATLFYLPGMGESLVPIWLPKVKLVGAKSMKKKLIKLTKEHGPLKALIEFRKWVVRSTKVEAYSNAFAKYYTYTAVLSSIGATFYVFEEQIKEFKAEAERTLELIESMGKRAQGIPENEEEMQSMIVQEIYTDFEKAFGDELNSEDKKLLMALIEEASEEAIVTLNEESIEQ